MDIVTAITDVFSAIGTWITTFLNSLVSIFWTAGSGETAGHLTFFGILAIIGLAISVFFLIMGVIQNFLHLRG